MGQDASPEDLTRLRDALRSADLTLPLDGVADATRVRDELVDQIDDYLLPRLSSLDAPLLAVVGGSTGSGKSTLVNSLIGSEVSQAGVLRPTTRAPVLICHPDDLDWFAGDGVLPDLPRTTGAHTTGQHLHLVTSTEVQAGLGLLDAPDIDSVELANHDLAAQLLGAADLWLFVTTASRYADAVPWQHLHRASDRAAAVALLVNRIPPTPDGSATQAITADVRRMLDAAGLPYSQIFAIEEVALRDGRLAGAEEEVRRWLDGLVADADARAQVIRATLQGAIDSLPGRTATVIAAQQAQTAAAAALREAAEAGVAAATRRVAEQLRSGILLRGEVLDRFREQVGTAEWMHRLQRGVGRLRDRVRAALTGDAPPVEAARGQLKDNLVGLIDDAVAGGIEDTLEAWRRLPGGTTVLAIGADPTAATPDPDASDTTDAIETSVAEWQDTVIAMVRRQAGGKLAVARGLSLGVNGVGVALMMSLFAATGGLTGGEVAITGGTAAVSQALLTAIFGEQAVRDLAEAARTDLLDRVEGLARARHQSLVDQLGHVGRPDAVTALHDAIEAVQAW